MYHLKDCCHAREENLWCKLHFSIDVPYEYQLVIKYLQSWSVKYWTLQLAIIKICLSGLGDEAWPSMLINLYLSHTWSLGWLQAKLSTAPGVMICKKYFALMMRLAWTGKQSGPKGHGVLADSLGAMYSRPNFPRKKWSATAHFIQNWHAQMKMNLQ